MQDRDFYLVTLWEGVPALRSAIESDPTLSRIALRKTAQLKTANEQGMKVTAAYSSIARWSDDEVAEVKAALAKIMDGDSRFSATLVSHMRSSGAYERYRDLADKDLVLRAWTDIAQAMNRCIGVYADGVHPQTPDDAPAYVTTETEYQNWIAIAVQVMVDAGSSRPLFTDVSKEFVLQLLRINGREDAAREKTLERAENERTWEKLRSVDWGAYRYSAIVLLGAASRLPGTELSPRAALRVDLAARCFAQKLAPVIIPTGGSVHPLGTHYIEAVAMKKELMERWSVPGDAILLEPCARHTTTNLRNAVRLIYRGRIPMEKEILVVSDAMHIATTAKKDFEIRCEKELGYLPARIVERPTEFSLGMMPDIRSLHRDAGDPLDP